MWSFLYSNTYTTIVEKLSFIKATYTYRYSDGNTTCHYIFRNPLVFKLFYIRFIYSLAIVIFSFVVGISVFLPKLL